MDIKILFEDEWMIAALKPSGIPIQPDKTGDVDLITMLKYNDLNPITRLDRPVGGVALFGKGKKGTALLSQSLDNGSIKKEYFAVTTAKLPNNNGILEDYLFKNGKTNTSVVAQKGRPGAKEARLIYHLAEEVADDGKNLFLVHINLLTGRHHQIRVQLANANAGIWGDKKYNPKASKGSANIALWAYSLTFVHPVTKKNITLRQKPIDYPFNIFHDEKFDLTFQDFVL